jgi:hypothetical protein
MRTYLLIFSVLIMGLLPLINATAQCSVPTTCANTGTATSCTLAASSTYYSMVSYTANNVTNSTNNNVVITSGTVKITATSGTSQLKPGVKLTAIPCYNLYYKITTASCGIGTGSSEGQTNGTQLTVSQNCHFVLKPYFRNSSGTELTGEGLSGSGTWRYKNGSASAVNYSTANQPVPICSVNFNIDGGTNTPLFTDAGQNWPCTDLNDDLLFYQAGSVQWPVVSFSAPTSGNASFSASTNGHFRRSEDEVTYDPSLSVYPNPNEGSFTLILPTTEAYEVSISDVSNTISKDYSLTNLSNGMYIVNVSGNGIQKRTKVQVMR